MSANPLLKWFTLAHLYWVLKYPNASILVQIQPESHSPSCSGLSSSSPDVSTMQASVCPRKGLLGSFPLDYAQCLILQKLPVCVCTNFSRERLYIASKQVVQEVFEPQKFGNHGVRTIIPLWLLAYFPRLSGGLRSLDLHVEYLAKIFKKSYASQEFKNSWYHKSLFPWSSSTGTDRGSIGAPNTWSYFPSKHLFTTKWSPLQL